MADLTQTAANVGLTADSGGTVKIVKAGEALTQGQPAYKHTDEKYYKTDANASAAAAAGVGIVLTPAATDEYFVLANTGTTVDLGATLTVGTTYIVSATAGGIAPIADAATGWYVTILGTATAAGKLPLNIKASGAAVP